MTNPSNAPIPPLVPHRDERGEDVDFTDVDAGFALDPLAPSDDEPLDPDRNADQVDSADADERAAAAGTKDGDTPE
jgi:hypothetical protein